ncbi:acyl-CoA dehydrogenase [Humidisolicoccus flavus]|uniref:acyl-CoA dehydrogenase n=1 Tax=Humidisolicoccus flavus TaxID=3111414 RepID=UPI00324F2AB5
MALRFRENDRSSGPLSRAVSGSLPETIDEALNFAVAHSSEWAAAERLEQWEALASIAAHDLAVARAVEPHFDAVNIFSELGEAPPRERFGVFAAEGGNDPLTARSTGHGWELTGTKPWCSLAAQLDSALVTAHISDEERALFRVDLRQNGVTVVPGAWHARGLAEIPSGPIRFESVAAQAVGAPSWYLTREGFALGGIGVAACWYGGAVGVARTVHDAAVTRPNPHLLAHLGAIDARLQDARRALNAASAPGIDPADTKILAKRVRATVANTCEEVLGRAARALGPGPLALDAAHAKQTADLALYVRQHHAERDQESLGRSVAELRHPW